MTDNQDLLVSAAWQTHATHSLASPPWPCSPVCWGFRFHCVMCPHPLRDPLTKVQWPGQGWWSLQGSVASRLYLGDQSRTQLADPSAGDNRQEAAFLPRCPREEVEARSFLGNGTAKLTLGSRRPTCCALEQSARGPLDAVIFRNHRKETALTGQPGSLQDMRFPVHRARHGKTSTWV